MTVVALQPSAAGQPNIDLIDITGISSKKFSWAGNELRSIIPFAIFAVCAIFGIKGVIMGNDSSVPQGIAVPMALYALFYLVYMLFLAVQRLARGVRGASKSIERTNSATRSKIKPFNVTLSDAIARVNGYFGPAPHGGARRDINKVGKASSYFLLWGVALPLLFILGFAVMHFIDRFLGIGVALLGGTVLNRIWRRGRQAAQPSADAQLAFDSRPPILLLRSFKDDLLTVTQRIKTTVEQDTPVTFEEALGSRLSNFGPFIGIGAPGEGLPQIGAARAYLSEDKWQDSVIRWMVDAKAITMIAGLTSWVQWELKQIIDRGLVGKLIIFLPPRQQDTASGDRGARWQPVLASFAATPWGAELRKLDAETLLAAAFGPGGQVLAIRCENELMQDYEAALMLCCYGIYCHDWNSQR